LSFRLHVDGDAANAASVGCEVPVVCLGADLGARGLAVGREVAIEGSLVERRWKGRSGIRQSRFEILAHTIRVL
jgi:hypothetical protein